MKTSFSSVSVVDSASSLTTRVDGVDVEEEETLGIVVSDIEVSSKTVTGGRREDASFGTTSTDAGSEVVDASTVGTAGGNELG